MLKIKEILKKASAFLMENNEESRYYTGFGWSDPGNEEETG